MAHHDLDTGVPMTVLAPASPLIRPVRAADSARAARVLARAFADDPVSRWMLRS